MRMLALAAAIVMAAPAILASVAVAAEAPVVVTDHARSRLFAETEAVAPGGALHLAFAQELQSGWHVYWKNPGDSGLPLEFSWTLPEGASAGAIDYPAPHRLPIGPLLNFGHEGAPVFLTTVTVPADAAIGSSVELGLEATWLICADICVPETGTFSLSVPVVGEPAKYSAAIPIFEAARAHAPEPFTGAASFAVAGGNIDLAIEGAPEGKDAYFFPAIAVSEPAAPQKARNENGLLRLSIKGGAELAMLGNTLDGVLEITTTDGVRSLALSATRDAEMPPASGANGAASDQERASARTPYAGLLLAAFFGGLLLNLMPCVFPILFIKAASLAKSASDERGVMRRHGLLYGAGVVATFALLGAVLIALRAGGEQVGWGFHLQSPAVILASAYVIFLVGLNLAGAFNIGSSLQNVGGGIASNGSDFSAFMTGALAVFVAAPCVGPFLTAPIGAAAILPAPQAMAIFIAMATGLAAPYTALSFSPALAKALPRPGPWMVRFRQILSFPVFAAAAFFLWVLSAQTGQKGLALGLGGLIALAFAARLWEWGAASRWARLAAIAVFLVGAAPIILVRTTQASPTQGVIAFDPADIDARRARGESVFIDFTAAWCVTCQFNKLTVLSEPDVKSAFRDNGVAFVTADWTNRDPVIEAALASFGANGVPLYVFYPKSAEPIVLAQPLTIEGVINAVSSADHR